MDNFDKLFNDKLNEITENDFEFKDVSWERFQNEWNENEEKKPATLPLWIKRNAVAAAVIGLLLLSNVFFAQQFLGTQGEIKKISNTVNDLQESVATCGEQTEHYSEIITDLKTKLEQQTNIIATQKEVIETQNERLVQQNQMSLQPVFSNQNRLIPNNNQNKTTNYFDNSLNSNDKNSTLSTINNNGTNAELSSRLTISEKPKNPLKNDLNNNSNTNEKTITPSPNQATTDNSEIVNNVQDIVLLDKLQMVLDDFYENVDIKKRPIPIVENEYKPDFETKLNLLKEDAKPSVYQLGFQSKYTFLPTFDYLPSMNMTNNGVIANALFFNNFRLQIGANYWGQFFKVEEVETFADGIITPFIDNYPVVTPVSGLDELTKIEAKIYGFDLPINAQILLRPNAKFNPYIGFGLNGRYINNYELEYYFIDYSTNYDYEVKSEEKVNNLDFGIWQSDIGMDYKVFDNWLINFEINYLRSFKGQTFGLPNIQQYGASFGIKYEF
ncbi:MAG: hypothetical protein AB8G11_20770 [Saprospiraceae bacterium]